MKKNKKREIGLKMQTREERRRKGLWGSWRFSEAWNKRRIAITERLEFKARRFSVRKAEREEALKEGKPVVYSMK